MSDERMPGDHAEYVAACNDAARARDAADAMVPAQPSEEGEGCVNCGHTLTGTPLCAAMGCLCAAHGTSTAGEWRETALAEAAEVQRLNAELASLRQQLAGLKDPHAVHVNILRGTIALTRLQALHIAGATDYDTLRQQLAEAEEDAND